MKKLTSKLILSVVLATAPFAALAARAQQADACWACRPDSGGIQRCTLIQGAGASNCAHNMFTTCALFGNCAGFN